MGSGAFIYASRFADMGLIGLGLVGPGCLILNIIVKLIIEGSYRCKHGRWFKKENSTWKTAEGKWYFF